MDRAWLEQVETAVEGIFQQARPGHPVGLGRARSALDEFVRSLGDVPLGNAAAMGRWASLGGDVVEAVAGLTPEAVIAAAEATRPDRGVARFGRKGLLVLADERLRHLEADGGSGAPAAELVAICAAGLLWERSVLDLPT